MIEATSQLPPHDIDAEKCVLAAMMLAANEPLFDEIAAAAPAAAFYQPDHAVLHRVLCELRKAGRPIDPIALRAELASRNQLGAVGGTAYLAEIVNTIPTTAHALHYAEIVVGRWKLREQIRVGERITRDAYKPHAGEDVNATLMAAAHDLMRCAVTGQSATYSTFEELAPQCMERTLDGKGEARLSTGFADLPYLLKRRFYLLAGRPSMGKSALGKIFVRGMASQGIGVGMITPDEPKDKVFDDMAAQISGLDRLAIEEGRLKPDQQRAYVEAVATLQGLPIYVADDITDIGEAEAVASLWKAQHGIQALYLDYISAFGSKAREAQSTYSRVTVVCNTVKQLLRRLDVAGLVICQLSRANTIRPDKRPTLADLRESGELEQAADAVYALHSESYYRREAGDYEGGPEFTECWALKTKIGARMRAFVMSSYLPSLRFLPLDMTEQRRYWQAMKKGGVA